MRHGAWLGAVPERPESDKSKGPGKSRLERLKDAARDEDFQPAMPDPGNAAYLLEHFWSVGPATGEHAITSTELRNYQENMGVVLSPWECRILRQLSIEYIGESHRASKRDCPPPFADSTDAARLKGAEMRRALDSFLN